MGRTCPTVGTVPRHSASQCRHRCHPRSKGCLHNLPGSSPNPSLNTLLPGGVGGAMMLKIVAASCPSPGAARQGERWSNGVDTTTAARATPEAAATRWRAPRNIPAPA